MGSKIKILFTSDIHLGFTAGDPNIPKDMRNKTFKKITSLACGYDILLIAGDLIENDCKDIDTINMIKEEFKRLNKCNTEVIYTPGFSEFDKNGEIIKEVLDAGASHIFTGKNGTEPYIYGKEGQEIFIYGMPASENFKISKIRRVSDKGFHIGSFHVDCNFRENKKNEYLFCLQREDIKLLNLDFYALGSNHNFRLFKIQGKIIGVYPGSPEVSSLNEKGDRYVVSITVADNKMADIRRLSINPPRIVELEVDCSAVDSPEELYNFISNYSSDSMILNLLLYGERNYSLDYDDFRLKLKNKFMDAKISDESFPDINLLINTYKNENNIRGEFFRILKDKVENNDMPENLTRKDLSFFISMINNRGFDLLEEWLCNISDA